jgi:predicted nucleotidyltransferase
MQRDRKPLLERTLGSKTKIAVLRRMCAYPGMEYTVTGLSKDVGLDKSLVSKVLKGLEEDGVVHFDFVGSAKVCRIEKDNFVVKNLVIPIFENEAGMAGKVASEVIGVLKPKTFKTILSVAIYGSFARGNYRPKSDVDLVVVVDNLSEKKKIKEKIMGGLESLLEKDIIVFSDVTSKAELNRLFRWKEPAVIDMIDNHRLLYGTDLKKIVSNP